MNRIGGVGRSGCTLVLGLVAGAAAAGFGNGAVADGGRICAHASSGGPDTNDPERALSEEDAAAALDEEWERVRARIAGGIDDDAMVEWDGHRMRLLVREFGDAPEDGRSLWISLHGGGGAPAEVNDQQWRNQIRLYEPAEGIYVAPRAPTDTWNLWHRAHIDPLLDALIARMVATRGVNPDRVYLLGYSAGGDGVYQLGPRMADRFAAAAMMAGHPNDARPEGLRNLPFAIFMGGRDSAYRRNEVAAEWGARLAALRAEDPEGYEHRVTIYPQHGHWMDGDDREAIPWMAGFERDPWAQRVVWRQDDVTHTRFAWLEVSEEDAVKGREIVADVEGQVIRIEGAGAERVTLHLRDELVDLDRAVTVVLKGHAVFSGRVERSRDAIRRSLASRADPRMAATAVLEVSPRVEVELLGRYETGVFGRSAAEIVAYDAGTRRLFVVNGAEKRVDVLSLADPREPGLLFSIDTSRFGGGVTSVAARDGLVAVAVEGETAQARGSIAVFDADGTLLGDSPAGALPDMVGFSPDGAFIVSANEGQPSDDYRDDPPGSVTVVDVRMGMEEGWERAARQAMFERFDAEGVPDGARVFGEGAGASRDLEPEYAAFSADSRRAYVVCQENNAIAVVDLARAEVTGLWPLGTVDHREIDHGLDASDRDEGVRIGAWPVRGMYQPDTIASYEAGGRTYLVTANEGDARDYEGFSEVARVAELELDTAAFPDAEELQRDENLGRLKVTTVMGDADGDGDFDALYSFGTRSVSIWDDRGGLVWDSGSLFERVTAAVLPDGFNSTNDANGSFDARSDDKGPEPEAVAVGHVGGRVLAFCGLERVGGIVVLDVSNPRSPVFLGYTNSRDFAGSAERGTAGDLGPEGLCFVGAAESPTGEPLLIAAHEVSGTVAVYRVTLPAD